MLGIPFLSGHGSLVEEAQLLPPRNRATRYVIKFVLCFIRYGSHKGFKQQK